MRPRLSVQTKRKLRKYAILFMAYFPIILVSTQVLLNLLSFAPKLYAASGFYLNTFFGTNVLFAVFLVIFTHMFAFCSVSRLCAYAELAFGVYYLVIQRDDLYNILFQITVGLVALFWTLRIYVKKFPFCDFSSLLRFLGNVWEEGSCRKGLEKYDRQDHKRIRQLFHHEHQ
jgi:hypothetical protein